MIEIGTKVKVLASCFYRPVYIGQVGIVLNILLEKSYGGNKEQHYAYVKFDDGCTTEIYITDLEEQHGSPLPEGSYWCKCGSITFNKSSRCCDCEGL